MNIHNDNIFDCVTIGDIFIDINVKMDINRIVKGGVSECDEFICMPAGISNIAVALSILGCKVALIGKCGSDIFGEFFIKDVENYRVTPYIFKDNLPTGLLLSLIDYFGERSFIILRGANNNLNTNEIKEILPKIKYKYLYTTGYSLAHYPQREAILYGMEIGKSASAITIFDPGSYNIINSNREYFLQALRFTDILSCNLEEALALTVTDNLNDALHNLSNSIKTVVIRLGKEGCIICIDKEVKRIPSYSIKTVDTTGAGDAFTGALIYGLINNWSVYKAAYFASLFAAYKVTKIGARSFPSNNEVQNILELISKLI